MAVASMRNRFVDVVSSLLDEDERIAVVLADISTDRFRASGAMRRHPARVVNVGIREALMVDVAGGMALEGMRPFAHTFAPFLVERAFEQVKLAFSHQGVGAVLVSAGASYDEAMYGRTHQGPGDVALMSTLPGWRIVVPGHADEVERFVRAAAASDEAVYIRLSERPNAEAHAPDDGSLRVMRQGSAGSPCIVAVGPMLDAALEATAAMDVTVVYVTTVRPLDEVKLRAAVTGSEVALLEPYLEGTSAAAVMAALSERSVRLLSIGVPNVEDRHYGGAAQHDEAFGLDAAGLRRRIDAWLHAGVTRGHDAKVAPINVA